MFAISNNEKVLETHPHLKEFLPFLDVHNNESPRGAVLTSCAYAEKLLGEIISAYLVEKSDKNILLEGFNAPIGTFSSRIKLAHALGLITDREKFVLETLKKIRNEFAHNHKCSFKVKKIEDLCEKLYPSDQEENKSLSSYSKYSLSSIGTIIGLINRPHYVGLKKLKTTEWPR